MRTYKIILSAIFPLFSLVLIGCITEKDVTENVDDKTDYVIGRTYRSKVPLFLFKGEPQEAPSLAKLGFAGTSKDLIEFQRQMAGRSQVVGLLEVGSEVRMEQLREHTSPTVGKFFILQGVIVTGKYSGAIVGLGIISIPDYKNDRLLIDNAILEQVN